MKKDIETALGAIIRQRVGESLDKNGIVTHRADRPQEIQAKKPVAGTPVIKEALVITPRQFVLKTEKLSKKTKESHEALYRKYADVFTKGSSELDAANKQSADSFGSLYRTLKMDECSNLNAVKLHELYFNNISDLASEIGVDSLPYIKLSRDFGNFENWQFDLMACAMSSREGWALTVYEPYRNVYMNVCVDGHAEGIPLGALPVVAIDMWSHAFFKDYDIDKKSYLVAMMRELNWDVVEARMILAEKSELPALYMIRPVYNGEPEKLLGRAEARPAVPIDNVNGRGGNVPPTTPPGPTTPMAQAEPQHQTQITQKRF